MTTAAVERALAEHHVPGCSVALVDSSGTFFSAGFGLADVRHHRAATPDTVYHLFSGTKLFTATAVLQLEERGLLSIDDRLGSFFPELSTVADVRVVELLSHTSGLRDPIRSFLAIRFADETLPTSGEALATYPLKATRPPGAQVAYGNVNYALLGELITRVAGMEYRDYVARHVLAPLGMQAGFVVTPEMRGRLATGYIGRRDPMRLATWLILPNTRGRLYAGTIDGLAELNDFNLATSAIGGLVGTVPDFARFVHAHLTDGAPILSEASTRRMQTLVAEGAAGIESRVGTGLGWKLGRAGARTFLNHEGGGAGFTSELRIYPDEGLGVALAMNQMRMPTTMRLAHRLCELFLARRDELISASPRA